VPAIAQAAAGEIEADSRHIDYQAKPGRQLDRIGKNLGGPLARYSHHAYFYLSQ
jgi:hypothetical protein